MSDKPFAAYQGVEPFLFASYAHADDAVVFPELLRLHEAGYRIWYDEGINPAEEWPRSISRALITSKLVLVFLSLRSLASKWVQREIGLAVSREKELLPVYLESLQLPDELEFQIGQVQAIHRYTLSPDGLFQQISRRLDKIPDIRRRLQDDIRDRIWNDMQVAAGVQKRMLPQALPCVPDYSFWATMEPFAGTPGGDLYDFHDLPSGEILVLVSDVAGKGIVASLGMAALAGIITTVVGAFGADLKGMMKAVNRAYLRRMQGADLFATLVAVALDSRAHQLRAVNAGHGPVLIRRRNGSIEDLVPRDRSGLPLGLFEEADYEVVTVALGPGDAVFIASDGISDAINLRKDVYGSKRINQVLTCTEGEAAQFGQAVLADVRAFTGTQALSDDATVVCFVRNPV
jgi:hypothetical protein